MIKSFRDRATERAFEGSFHRSIPTDLRRPVQRKLAMLDAATVLDDLRAPPANRLEKLSGNREGQHSIRVNNQWRICFVWHDNDAYDVEFTDYH